MLLSKYLCGSELCLAGRRDGHDVAVEAVQHGAQLVDGRVPRVADTQALGVEPRSRRMLHNFAREVLVGAWAPVDPPTVKDTQK